MVGNQDDSDSSFNWSQDEDEPCFSSHDSNFMTPSEAGVCGAEGSTSNQARSNAIIHFSAMGFAEDLVIKIIDESGEENPDAILETLLAYTAPEECAPQDEPVYSYPNSLDMDWNTSDDLSDFSDADSCLQNELEPSPEMKMMQLVEMGYSTDIVSAAIDSCDPDTCFEELMDYISAAQMAETTSNHLVELPHALPDVKKKKPALPQTSRWWPSWDTRSKLNCLLTVMGSATETDRVRKHLEGCGTYPPETIRKLVLKQCRKWNFVWTGYNRVAPLDTVAYHLSVLKNLFPNGISVLSLFSGIGGAEVALHRLGIRLNFVVAVEKCEENRYIFKGWWENTEQQGILIDDITDVKMLTTEKLQKLVEYYGGFDLIIGGSPCNNLSGSNRLHRDGLQGSHSVLFFEFCRILETVRGLMNPN
ncbi:hypothetical protein MKW94_005046 [Papaver nudicaule]|uniref:DNA (cytosine-5-)-methyltransferase n=1 Tax=Papaver nudicaule TaxID=74823 RepID=A0AA41SJZ4_PAPNU|nr:hypothetical protein [Papaver nudicaule]